LKWVVKIVRSPNDKLTYKNTMFKVNMKGTMNFYIIALHYASSLRFATVPIIKSRENKFSVFQNYTMQTDVQFSAFLTSATEECESSISILNRFYPQRKRSNIHWVGVGQPQRLTLEKVMTTHLPAQN